MDDTFDEFDEFFVFEDTIPNIVSYSVILGKEVRNELRLIRSELPEPVYNAFLKEADVTANTFIQMFAGALLSGNIKMLRHMQAFLERIAEIETLKIEARLFDNIVFNDIVEGFDSDSDPDSDDSDGSADTPPAS